MSHLKFWHETNTRNGRFSLRPCVYLHVELHSKVVMERDRGERRMFGEKRGEVRCDIQACETVSLMLWTKDTSPLKGTLACTHTHTHTHTQIRQYYHEYRWTREQLGSSSAEPTLCVPGSPPLEPGWTSLCLRILLSYPLIYLTPCLIDILYRITRVL